MANHVIVAFNNDKAECILKSKKKKERKRRQKILRKTGRRKEVIILSLGFLACVLHIVRHMLQISQ